MKKLKDRLIYITRDTYLDSVEIWPEDVGIRAFDGCVVYGAAWNQKCWTTRLTRRSRRRCELIEKAECRKRFGFYPRAGTAWYINGKGKAKQEHLAFSP